MKLLYITILLLALISFSAQGQAATLPDLIKHARQNNSKYLSDKARQLAELEKWPEAKSYLYPNISANYSEIYTNESLFAPDLPFVTQGSADYRSQSYGVRFRQALFNKEVMANYRQGKFVFALAIVELKIIENNLILQVAKAYFDVLKKQTKVVLADSSVAFTLENYTLLQEQLKQRLINQADNQKAKARWLLAVADSQTAYNNLENALLNISRLTGSVWEKAHFLTEAKINAEIQNHDENKVLESNFQYLKQEIILAAAKNSVAIQKAKHYPTLELVIDHNVNNTDGSLSGPASERDDTRALIQLSVPLFLGGRIRSLIRAEKHKLESAKYELLGVREEVLQENKLLLSQIRALKKRLAALDEAVDASKFVLLARREMYLEGIGGNSRVLESQKEFFEASVEKKNTFYDQQYLLLKYLYNTGMLTAALYDL